MSGTDSIEAKRLLAEERVRKANERNRRLVMPPETGENPPENRTDGEGKKGFDLRELLKDSDALLLIGVLLLLSSENSDKILIFAIMYILL